MIKKNTILSCKWFTNSDVVQLGYASKLVLLTCLSLFFVGCAKPQTSYPVIDKTKVKAEAQNHVDYSKRAPKFDQAQEYVRTNEQLFRLDRLKGPIIKAGTEVCKRLYPSKGCVYDIELAEKGGVNAYADGKKIVMLPGMMEFASNDNELAVVLGHEYAHNIMSHVTSSVKNSTLGRLAGGLIDVLAASQGISTSGQFSKFGGMAGRMRYSQDFEREADYVGLYVTARAGFNIDKVPHFWRRMSSANEKAIYAASTHPTNPERFLLLEQTIAEIEAKKQAGQPLLPNFRPPEANKGLF